MWRKTLGLALVALVLIIGVRTVTVPSRQAPTQSATVTVDGGRAPDLLARAIQFPTTNREEVARMQAFLDETWPRVRQALPLEKVNELGRLYRWTGSDASLAPVVLMAHQDVVPVEKGSEAQWPHPPFSGAIAEGAIWGRGATDDKIGLVGIFEAVERLLEQGFQPRRTVYLAFGQDEETLGEQGAKSIVALLQARGVHPEGVFDEGGAITTGLVPGVDRPAAVVAIAEKGYADFELKATGEPGHSSTPPRSTAIGILARAIQAIEDHPMPATLDTAAGRTLDYIAPAAKPAFRVLLANRWLADPIIMRVMQSKPASNATVRTVCSANVIEGGVKSNQLPQSARAVVNCRLIPGDTADKVAAHFTRVIGDSRVKVSVLTADNASPEAPPESAAGKALKTALRQIYPEAIHVPSLAIGATDGRYFAALTPNVYRFSPIHVTPETLKQMHGPAEHISVEDAKTAVRFYAQLILNLCGR